MNTSKLFRELGENGYAVSTCLMWNRRDVDSVLSSIGVDMFERSCLSDTDKEILLSEFFDSIEDQITETIGGLMLDYFSQRIKEKKPLNVSEQLF